MENNYDIAVVGGGSVGLMTACELAIQGINVVVLERRVDRIRNSRPLILPPAHWNWWPWEALKIDFYLEERN